MTDTPVWCRLIDYEKKATFGDAFSVQAPPNATIESLKEKAKEKRWAALKHIDPASLTVWRCMNPELRTSMDGWELEEALSIVDFTDKTKVKRLSGGQQICAQSSGNEILLIEVPVVGEPHRPITPHNQTIPRTGDDSSVNQGAPLNFPGSIYLRESNVSGYEESLWKLHEMVWATKDATKVFSEHKVKRDGTYQHHSEVPRVVTALGLDEGEDPNPVHGLLQLFGLSAMLVRDEYLCALQDIISLLEPDKRKVNDDVSGDPDDDVDNNPENDAENGMDVDRNDDKAAQQKSLYNPFYSSIQWVSEAKGVSLTGSPGVGKSLFLIYVLVLRLLAGKTTLYQRRPGYCHIFNDQGVLRSPIDPAPNLLAGTWLLIDSNWELKAVPENLTEACTLCKGFILQAASPRMERLEWCNKYGPIHCFWMAPWSLGELISARKFQTSNYLEQEIAEFCNRYGTATRAVYNHARESFVYEAMLTRKFDTLNWEKIDMLIAAAGSGFDDTISHFILVPCPEPHDRRDFFLMIPTRYIARRLVTRSIQAGNQVSSRFYRVFSSTPRTRAAAGHLLEIEIVESFPKGGQWQVATMDKKEPTQCQKNVYWKSDPKADERWLALGTPDRLFDIVDAQFQEPYQFRGVEVTHFEQDAILPLVSGFYVPKSPTQPSFDALIYDSTNKTAVIFQVTVALSHPISELGLTWLRGLGVQRIVLVVVTPPLHANTKQDICVPRSAVGQLNEVYHLQLDFSPASMVLDTRVH